MENRFENEKFVIEWFPKDKLVDFFIKQKELEKEDIIQMHEVVLGMTKTERYATIFRATGFFSLSPEARAEGSREHYSTFLIVQAFVVKNLAQRLVGNFIMRFNPPTRETKLFTSREDAVTWLKMKIAEEEKQNKPQSLLAL